MAGFAEVFIHRSSKEYKSKAYKSEKAFETEVCENIEMFCENILADKYISHKRQSSILGRKGGNKKTSNGLLTADLIIDCLRDSYVVELKRPIYKSENRQALGQLLNYGRYYPKHKLVLCSTEIDTDAAETIDYYKLPITYVFLDKERYAIHKDLV